MRIGLVLSFVAATSLLSLAASANGGGVAGYTGKPTSFSPQGESCNQCHNGGIAPQVSITGPATLAAGQVGDYTLVVSTGQPRAAGAVAATDGVALTPSAGGGFRDSFGEMVQDGSKAPSGGQATFTFRVKAPLTGNTLRLWGVGLAANGSGAGGDRATHVTRDITVTGGAPPPQSDGGAPSSSSSSSSSGASSGGASSSGGPSTSGSSSGGTTTSGANGGVENGNDAEPSDPDDGNDNGSSSGRMRSAGGESAACSATFVPVTGSDTLALGAALGCVLLFLRRTGARRRPDRVR
jgi:hypothetical protein